MLDSRSDGPPLDDLAGTLQEAPDGGKAVLSSMMKAGIAMGSGSKKGP